MSNRDEVLVTVLSMLVYVVTLKASKAASKHVEIQEMLCRILLPDQRVITEGSYTGGLTLHYHP